MIPPRNTLALVATAMVLSICTGPALAQSGESVAVIINDASPESQRIGEYYARKRTIPPDNIIHIKTAAKETVDRAEFTRSIETPIAKAITGRALHDRILYIVVTKGVPLRIEGTSGQDGTVASVDSELTLLYRRMTGAPVPVIGSVPNPYYLADKDIREARAFTHREHDIFLVTRLDAFTVDEVIALIDRAQAPAAEGRIVLDQRAGLHADNTGDAWLAEAARRLESAGQGQRVVLEKSTGPARNIDGVLGYYSWGSNDAANRVRRFEMRFVPGALAATFVSSDGRTFSAPPDTWGPSGTWNNRSKLFAGSPQTLTGDLIREGVTGVAGHVAEPYLGSTVRPQILFPTYLAGRNLAEAFYLAIPYLSWQTVVIGDPLCAPFPRKTLTRSDIEEPKNPLLDLPAMFGTRRLENLRRGFNNLPDKSLALLVRAEAKLLLDDKAAARQALEALTATHPDVWSAQLQLALIYEQMSDRERAIPRYRKVLDTQPNNVVALNNLAFALAQKGAAAEALPLARRAAALSPEDPTIIDTLGWVQHLSGNHRDAAQLLGQAVRLAPKNAEIQLHLAVTMAELGDLAAARKHLEEAVKIDAAIEEQPEARALKRRLEKQEERTM